MQTVTRLFDFPYYQLEKNPLQKALVTKYNGKWVATSTQEYINQANAISRALLTMGVQPHDKIAVIAMTNRTEWNIIDLGVLQIGAQNVPVYPGISPAEYEYVLRHSEARYCFVSCQKVLEKVLQVKPNLPALQEVYSFDVLPDCKNWKELLRLGADESKQEAVEKAKQKVQPNDVATLIYTSGTTGTPKGVMLSHHNLVSNVLESSKRFPRLDTAATALSFLPLCHVYERMLLYLYQYRAVSVCYAESLDTISQNLKETAPHIITTVPRLLEKVYDAIITRGKELKGIKKKLFFWAVRIGLRYEPYGQNGWWYEQKLALARKLIFRKWKEGLGGNLTLIACGSAALQPRLARIFNAAGLGVMEGYGLTETAPVVSVNDLRNHGFKIGTVGKPIDQTEVKIAADGEIYIKGPQVMQGYYKDPEKTAEVLIDGYFHTGDIGELDAEGFLKITDRKKEMFKTSGGKYIAPQLLENRCKESRFIEQIMVIGEGEKMPAALIQPDFEWLRQWAQRHNLPFDKNEDLIVHEKVIARIQREVDRANANFAQWEKIKQFRLTPEVWSVEQGHLTPTMKLKRKIIKEKYLELYHDIYA